MLGNPYFYNRLFMKYLSVIGTLFNDIYVERTDGGTTIKVIKVPVMYAAKDKVLIRNDEEPTLQQYGREMAVSLPIITFECTNWTYNGDAKQASTHQYMGPMDETGGSSVFVPVYYDLDWRVSVYVKNAEDGTKIIEQILPFFTPDFTPRVELIPEMNITRNIPVFLTGVECDDSFDGYPTDRRKIVWTLSLRMKGAPFYGPTKKSTVIKFANVNFYNATTTNIRDAIGVTDPAARVTVQPGLTANGAATTDINETIPYIEINADDPYGYISIHYDPLLEE